MVYIKRRCKWSLYTRLKWKRRKDIQAIISEAVKWCEQKWGPNNRRSDVLWIDVSWKKSECAGLYQYQDNEITIFVKEHLTVRDLIDTVIHEYTHYKQPMSKYSKLLKKNGLMFVATLNKTLKSYVFAIIGAEYVLRWLPIGTHDWEKFVKPEDLKNILLKNSLKLDKLDGMNFNIIKDEWSVSKDTSVNYIAKFIKC